VPAQEEQQPGPETKRRNQAQEEQQPAAVTPREAMAARCREVLSTAAGPEAAPGAGAACELAAVRCWSWS
jgi:hypothetical protein